MVSTFRDRLILFGIDDDDQILFDLKDLKDYTGGGETGERETFSTDGRPADKTSEWHALNHQDHEEEGIKHHR